MADDVDRLLRRRVLGAVLHQLGEQMGDVHGGTADGLGVLDRHERDAGEVLDLADGNADHVGQPDVAGTPPGGLGAGQYQQRLGVAAHPGREVVEAEQVLQLVGILLVRLEAVDELDLPVEQRLVAPRQVYEDVADALAQRHLLLGGHRDHGATQLVQGRSDLGELVSRAGLDLGESQSLHAGTRLEAVHEGRHLLLGDLPGGIGEAAQRGGEVAADDERQEQDENARTHGTGREVDHRGVGGVGGRGEPGDVGGVTGTLDTDHGVEAVTHRRRPRVRVGAERRPGVGAGEFGERVVGPSRADRRSCGVETLELLGAGVVLVGVVEHAGPLDELPGGDGIGGTPLRRGVGGEEPCCGRCGSGFGLDASCQPPPASRGRGGPIGDEFEPADRRQMAVDQVRVRLGGGRSGGARRPGRVELTTPATQRAEVLRDGGIAAERFAAPGEHGVEPGTGLVGGDPLRHQGGLELGRRSGRHGRCGDPFDLEPVNVGRRRRCDLGGLPGRLSGVAVVEPGLHPEAGEPAQSQRRRQEHDQQLRTDVESGEHVIL